MHKKRIMAIAVSVIVGPTKIRNLCISNVSLTAALATFNMKLRRHWTVVAAGQLPPHFIRILEFSGQLSLSFLTVVPGPKPLSNVEHRSCPPHPAVQSRFRQPEVRRDGI